MHRWRNAAAKLPKNDTELHARVGAAYWAALDEATYAADGEARLRRLVADLECQYPSAACLTEDLPALCVHSRTRCGCARRTCWSGRWRR